MHSPSQTKPLSLNTLSQYQYISSIAYPLSILSTRPYHQEMPSSFHLDPSSLCLICAFGTLSILLIPSNILRLSICRPLILILDLSFSSHNIVSLSYIRIGTNNVSCKNLAQSSCKRVLDVRQARRIVQDRIEW